ncbi:MAG: cytochrome c nitrite reductase small subunit [Caldilineales bacterium]|nr:cytochrome c nitrite reductase small subunit [Caldilineales bacterium]MDW8317600.1 cytochrome c nitrite reductase small subunit [Anaerolineae bacterium]
MANTRAVLATITFAMLGILIGVGGYTFYYARGASYLSDDPNACANCHVMREQLASWEKSSHRAVATCNACHTPHSLVGKYATKLENGYRHSAAFTLQNWHDPIRMREASVQIVLNNCQDCHRQMVSQLPEHLVEPGSPITCITCHRGVGHAGK